MFGISSLGWVHTLGSLPAIPAAAYMFVRHGRIFPRSPAGIFYFCTMMIGILTIPLIAHKPESYVIAAATLSFLLVGYCVGLLPGFTRSKTYIETIALSVTVFLLMVPATTETLRRVPNGHPFVSDLKSPILLGAQGALFVALLMGLTFQLIQLSRKSSRQ